MYDDIYDNEPDVARDNIVLVAQACHGVLTKRHLISGETRSYDRVKHYNFFEVNLWTLDELFELSKQLLYKSRCCLVRARLKDRTKQFRLLRRYKDNADGGEPSLIQYRCNWFALDVDGYGTSLGDLRADAHQVLLALPGAFHGVDCFAVASASYGRKTGIHMRLFFWSQNEVATGDLFRFLKGNKAKVDMALFENPVQPIYTAKPIYDVGDDPIKERIIWINGDSPYVNVPSLDPSARGAPEIAYTKQQADAFVTKYLMEITKLRSGDRHNGLIRLCILLGKMVGQDHYERNDIVDRAMAHCSLWYGKRDTSKDEETIKYAVDLGIDSIVEEGTTP